MTDSIDYNVIINSAIGFIVGFFFARFLAFLKRRRKK